MTVLRQGTFYERADGSPITAVFPDAPGTPAYGTGTAAAAASTTVSLAAVAGKTNYLTGFTITTGLAAAAVEGLVTITGLALGTLNYRIAATTAIPESLVFKFPTPLAASAVNTAITINWPAITSGPAVAINVHGFYA